jgi:hypothetical protein
MLVLLDLQFYSPSGAEKLPVEDGLCLDLDNSF